MNVSQSWVDHRKSIFQICHDIISFHRYQKSTMREFSDNPSYQYPIETGLKQQMFFVDKVNVIQKLFLNNPIIEPKCIWACHTNGG